MIHCNWGTYIMLPSIEWMYAYFIQCFIFWLAVWNGLPSRWANLGFWTILTTKSQHVLIIWQWSLSRQLLVGSLIASHLVWSGLSSLRYVQCHISSLCKVNNRIGFSILCLFYHSRQSYFSICGRLQSLHFYLRRNWTTGINLKDV